MEDLNVRQECASAFDAHHAPSNEIIEKCVHCGFCLPVCPTYVLWGQEMDSPRGRIYLMKLASEGAAEMNSNWVSHFDSCLGCMACMTACPSGVDYGKLIEATRAQIERKTERPGGERLHRRFMFETFTRPDRLRQMRLPLLAYQKSGLQAVVRSLGLLKLFPKKMQTMEALLPKLGPREAIAEFTPAAGKKRRRVGLLLGCVQREFFPRVNAATVRVLAAEGCEVLAPKAQSCCGALLVHAGEEAAALDLAKKTIDVFESAYVDTIVTNAAGCGSNVKEYGHLLAHDAAYADKAKRVSGLCKDISEILLQFESELQKKLKGKINKRVSYHPPCTLQHGQKIRGTVESVLRAVGVDVQLCADSHLCCGSAGTYSVLQPELATKLRDNKLANLQVIQPEMIVSANIGCLVHLQSGTEVPVKHWIELVDAALVSAG